LFIADPCLKFGVKLMAEDQKPPERLKKYILRNISNNDINLGDLRYTIPVKQARDLLGKNAHLNYDEIMKSRESGSISKKLGKSLIEVSNNVQPSLPKKTLAGPTIVHFPQKTKSSIVIDISELSDDVQQEILSEEDELLKQLDQFYEENSAPIIAKKEDQPSKGFKVGKDEKKKKNKTEDLL
jgi:hypothetical protein